MTKEILNKNKIADLLPHRDPMLLIDELHDIQKLSSATAIVYVKKDSFFVQGHFPNNPVMPGVLIVAKTELDITDEIINIINTEIKEFKIK